MADDNEFAQFADQSPGDDTNPFAQFAPQTEDNPFVQFAPKSSNPESSFLGAFGRGVAEQQVPTLGGLAGAGAGAAIGTAVLPGAGTVVGAIAGGLGGALLAGKGQDALLDKSGLKGPDGPLSDEQLQADREQHPWARRAADVVSTAEAFAGGPASGAARLASAGINAGIEGGQQIVSGHFDPTDIALKAATGYVLPNTRAWADKVFGVGSAVGEKLAKGVAGRTSPVSTRGASESATPPPENIDIGNDTSPPERSERVYDKDNATPQDTQGVTQGDIAPDTTAALASDAKPQEVAQPEQQAPQFGTAPEAPRYKNPIQPEQAINRGIPVSGLARRSPNGNEVYIDRNIPRSVDVAGKPIDPAVPLSVRATQGDAAMDGLLQQHGYDPQAFREAVGLPKSEPVKAEEPKTAEPQTVTEPAKTDLENLSDADLNKITHPETPEPKDWKGITEDQTETQSAKTARLKSLREGLADDSGSVALPSFKDVPKDAWKSVFGSDEKPALVMVRKFLAPDTVSSLSKDAAAIIRQENGRSAQDLQQSAASVEQFRRIVNQAPEDHRLNIIQHMDDPKNNPLVNPKYKPVVDTLRPLFEDMKGRLQELPSYQQREFIENYFPHMYKTENGKPANYASFTKQGSTSSLKQRTIPTIAEALDKGFKLATTDPIETTMRYLSSMHAYLRQMEILQKGIDSGNVKALEIENKGGASGTPYPSSVPEGYVKLEGRSLKPNEALYAKEDWARVYNNFVGKRLGGDSERAQFWNSLQKVSNGVTGLELGLSGYHVFTMAKESMISDFALGLSKLAGGDLSGGKNLARSLIAPVDLALRGSKVQKLHLGDTESVPPELSQYALDIMRDSGARLLGRSHDPSYEFSGMGSLWTAWRRGALPREWADIKSRIGEQPGAYKAWQAAKEVASGIGRVMQTVAAPIFEKYIPAVKAGAYYDTVAEYIKAHPEASREELVAAARKIGDSIDNRFGEMVQDNIFINNAMKQSAQIAMRSWSWNIGTIREIGGGILGTLQHPERLSIKSKDYDPRIAYVIAMPVMVGLTSMVYQYLKTGKGPGDAIDLVTPKTGGESAAYNAPERAILPGYEKDVIGYVSDLQKELTNKLATAPRLAWETWTNKDYRDKIIRTPTDPVSKQVMDYLKHVGGSVGPISVKQMLEGGDKGSNINLAERSAAIRPAPGMMINPAAVQNSQLRRNIKDAKSKAISDAYIQGRKQ